MAYVPSNILKRNKKKGRGEVGNRLLDNLSAQTSPVKQAKSHYTASVLDYAQQTPSAKGSVNAPGQVGTFFCLQE